ncbi:MAG: STAS domain-containing protein [Rubricoccaceae bacterium]|nr:STAS domain-containing protein [Rubricoccaceae bacterium]
MMQFDVDERGGVATLALSGDVMGGPDGAALHDHLQRLKTEGRRNVVVDLDGVRFMNSSGLGMLIGALTTMRNGGGDLRLARVGQRVQSLLVITKLAAVFQCYDSVDEAVASFQ